MDTTGVLTLTTLRDIKAGEEVTISYVPLMTEKKDRRERLHATHGFLCECIRCHNTILCPKAMCRAPMSMNDGESKYVCTARTPGASSAGDDSMGQDGGSKGDGVCQGWRSVHEVEETLYRLTRRYQAVQDHIVQAYGLHMTSTASLLDHSSNKHDDSTRDRKRTYMVGEGTNPFFKDLTEDEKKKRKYFVEKANKEIENSHAEAAELLGVRDTLEANNDPASGENTPCTYTHPFYFSLVLLIETKIGRRYARPLKLRSNGKMSQDLLFPSLSTQHQTAEATGDDDADADFFSSDAFNGDGDDDDDSSDSDGEE